MGNKRDQGPLSRTRRIEFDIANAVFFKIALAAFLIFLVLKLSTLVMMLFLGVMLATTLDPFVQKLHRYRIPKFLAIGAIALTMVAFILLVGLVLMPSMATQVSNLIQNFPDIKTGIIDRISDASPFKKMILHFYQTAAMPSPEVMIGNAFGFLGHAFEGMSEFFMVLVFSIYWLIDGRRMLTWTSDFFSAPVRLKIQVTAHEVAPVIHAYIQAQLLTSVLSGFFAYIILQSLGVPAALTLAMVAAVFDILPILGFFIAVIPAALLALSLSVESACAVVVLYMAYHAVENYLILPVIYGKTMKMRPLVILLTLLIAGTIGGVLAAITALPLVASYPLLERIWLTKYLGRHIVRKHADGNEVKKDQMLMWNEKMMDFSRSHAIVEDREMMRTFRRTVLLIEDDVDVRALLKEVLETEGYRVCEAGNGMDGLKSLRQNSGIGLIVLDLRMPVMDGRLFLEFLHKESQFAEIPVIFLSADAGQEQVRGAREILKKPVDFDLLLNLVHRHYQASSLSH